ncbi:MAG: hypothetical protein CL930_15335 [Deltaproteobacteria bacterium]|nr:hypothetical protein [Deltaproteobacteria bacterium]
MCGVGWIFFAALALSFGLVPKTVALVCLTVGVFSTIGVALWPVRSVLSPAVIRSHRRQARKVEARLPGLRGRLITVIELDSSAHSTSPSLFLRAEKHASRAISMLAPKDVHSGSAVRRLWAVCGGLVLVVALVGRLLPIGPTDAVAILLGQSVSSVRLDDTEIEGADEDAIVGDITLRYLYPTYTGLEPKEVPNSDGTIHAPPGTVVRIRARTARPFDGAGVQVDEGDPVDALLNAGRDITAEITVQQSGTWRFLLFDGDRAIASRSLEIQVEDDAPPVVVISETGEKAVPVDVPLRLGWQVTDDYGITRVSVEIESEAGTTSEVRREPIDTVVELSGTERATPRSLGLVAGQTITLRMVAVDNDRAQGGNRGESEPLVLTVMGPQGYGRNLARYHEKLLDTLLSALADFLEERVPPANSRPGLIEWVSSARKRLDPIRKTYEDQWGEEQSSNIDGVLVRGVLEAGARLFRSTMTTFDRDVAEGGQQPVERDLETFAQLHGETIESLEQAAFVIDSMLKKVGIDQLARQARTVSESAKSLAADAQEMDEPGELYARLDQLERMLSQMRKTASRLSDGSLEEFTNSTLDQVSGHMDEIRKAISEGDLDAARKMLEDLAAQLESFAEGLDDRQKRQQEGENELGERYKKLMADLLELGEAQESLAQQLADKQKEHGADFSDVIALWEQLDNLALSLDEESIGVLEIVGDGRDWRPFTVSNLQDVRHLSAGIRDSVRGRDAEAVLLRILELGDELSMVSRFVERESRGTSPTPGAGQVLEALERQRLIQAEMVEILKQLVTKPLQSNPEVQAAARALSQEQGAMKDRQRELAQEVQTIENAMPTGTGKAQEAMAEAGESMDRAQNALEMGSVMVGEGHQRHASDQINETRQHLEQAMQQQQQMKRMMRQMNGEEGGDQTGNETEGMAMEQPEIPAPELFKTPEAYREALLEGMSGNVPEEFKALKRRFYEDLVRQ